MPRSSARHLDAGDTPRGLSSGRTGQKRRTRDALIAAARELVAKGSTPNVEDAAAAAGISRTTAYRYFRNQAELLAAAHPELEATSLLPERPPSDVHDRLDHVVRELLGRVIDGEAQYRTMLRLSLEPEAPGKPLLLRQGRAIRWIEDALAPIRAKFSKAHFDRLVRAIRTTVGIEALVWLTDVAGLTRAQAVKNMQWAAGALLSAALAEAR